MKQEIKGADASYVFLKTIFPKVSTAFPCIYQHCSIAWRFPIPTRSTIKWSISHGQPSGVFRFVSYIPHLIFTIRWDEYHKDGWIDCLEGSLGEWCKFHSHCRFSRGNSSNTLWSCRGSRISIYYHAIIVHYNAYLYIKIIEIDIKRDIVEPASTARDFFFHNAEFCHSFFRFDSAEGKKHSRARFNASRKRPRSWNRVPWQQKDGYP